MDKNIIGVRFTKIGKIYHFDSSAIPDLGVGEHVIVDTSRGRHLGEVVQVVKEMPHLLLVERLQFFLRDRPNPIHL